nr:hypothetical protein [Amycolatopsis suaedae]
MTAIATAMRAGDRQRLLELWDRIGVAGDPLHRCTLAHYLADVHDEAAESLAWDIRALDAADTLTDERAQRHDGALRVRGFYPSLHLNLADDYRRLGAFGPARRHLDAARERVADLPDGDYGELIRAGIEHVATALADGSTERLPTH